MEILVLLARLGLEKLKSLRSKINPCPNILTHGSLF